MMKKVLLFFIYWYGLFFAMDTHAQGWVWGKGNIGAGIDAWAVATDASGNVYGAGYRYIGGSDTFGSVIVPPPPSGTQTLWAKYSSTGTVLWADGTTSGNTTLYNITTDPAGNLIIFGAFLSSTMQIGSFTLTNAYSGTAWQYYLAKINPTGTVLWAINNGNTIGAYYCYLSACVMSMGGVATDAAGNIYISSSFTKPTMTIESYTFTNAGGNDIFIAKYNPSGILMWATSVGGAGDDYNFGITVASIGNVYITGAFYSPSVTVGSSVISDPYSTGTPVVPYAYIAKFSGATGAPLWAQAAGGPNGAFGVGLTRDAKGNVYMTGGFADNSISFGSAAINQTYPSTTGKLALYLLQYSPADVVTWSKTIGSPIQHLWGYCIALASCGQVWVSGNYNEQANIDGHTLALAPGPDPIFIAGYDLSGGVVGYAGLGSGGDDQNGIAADGYGNIFICSDYKDGAFIVGADTLPSQPNEHFFVGKYANTAAPPDTNYTHHDTTICGSNSIVLTAAAGYSTYYWNDSTVLPIRTVSATGTYWVYNITCGVPVLVDTFNITMASYDTAYTHKDTSVCMGLSPATLPAPAGYTSYLWSTGNTSTSIAANSIGTYIAYCKSACHVLIDTFHFSLTANDTTVTYKDISLCTLPGALMLTGPSGYNSYIWSSGSAASFITVTKPGSYILTATNGCNVAIDTFNLTQRPNPTVKLGNDKKIFPGNALNLFSPEPAGSTYLWNTGSRSPYLSVATSGTYWLTVTNEWGCSATDTIHLSDSTVSDIDIPNAFSPGGANKLFKIIITGNVTLHYFRIYNRWGTMVYETNDITAGWNGKYN
ncbi:MAG: gliding motility-associated C-terminal domain-containing protein, partial [Chitinophagales bacterium]